MRGRRTQRAADEGILPIFQRWESRCLERRIPVPRDQPLHVMATAIQIEFATLLPPGAIDSARNVSMATCVTTVPSTSQ